MQGFLRMRAKVAGILNRISPYRRINSLQSQLDALECNFDYECGLASRRAPAVLAPLETLKCIKDRRLSFYRYGDGEFQMVAGQNMSFQRYDPELCTALRDILQHPLKQGMCGIPNIFGSLNQFKGDVRRYWRSVALWAAESCLPYFNSNAFYGDACVSRPSIRAWTDVTLVPKVFDAWKELFDDQSILVVEGRYSRLGVGNDLLDGARAVQRIWCPPTNAYARYKEILEVVQRHAENKLVLLALGATATVLAYDLCKAGFWAVDAGHVDLEYIWMKMGATKKVPIPGRYVNEVVDGGREMTKVPGEEETLHVVATIGV